MSEVSKQLLQGTTKQDPMPAALMLEDGTYFAGTQCGATGEVYGEICFNTSLEGYLEVLTDPSYAGQIVTMTYPQIGNYGVSLDDVQSASPALSGLVVRDMCAHPSNWRSGLSLPEFLKMKGIVALEGIDTRALVRHVRDNGAMRAVLSTEDVSPESLLAKVRASAQLVGENHVQRVSCDEPRAVGTADLPEGHKFAVTESEPGRYKVVAYDCGAKESILQNLVRCGCDLTVVPWDTPAEEVLAMNPDGVFLSNGPGDPEAVEGTYTQVEKLLGQVPIFGICLGHQMISKASGADIEKLKYGHRGGNHPVMNLRTGRVEITAQNHGFGLVWPTPWQSDSQSFRGLQEPPARPALLGACEGGAGGGQPSLRPHPADAREPQRRHAGGHRLLGYPRVQCAVPPGGVARAHRRPLPVHRLHPPDGRP